MTVLASQVKLEDRLRGIQAISDAALYRLDDHDFLSRLLEQTRTTLQVDTAAVLRFDFAAGELIATAGAGLEERVALGARIPVGREFAGRIAAWQQPVVLNHLDRTTVVNPILWSKGIQALIGVPLIAGGKVLGVLHAGSVTPREFTVEDIELLQLVAGLAASAVQSLVAREDRVATTALQRSLLPSALPAIGGIELAGRYVPGKGAVGGDWYDVFALPAGQVCVVIGDVAGSGLAAAVIMGRMRSALRAYALETADPAEILAKLDAKMQYFEPGALATVSCAVLDPGLDQMRICVAGHFPPVIASPGHLAELADVPAGLLIGAAHGARRQVATIEIRPGTLACFYTDGLIERHGQTIDQGLERLCQAVAAQPPGAACADVMNTLAGCEPPSDDIALLMLLRPQLRNRAGQGAARPLWRNS